jgi:hypothetical protein
MVPTHTSYYLIESLQFVLIIAIIITLYGLIRTAREAKE